MAIDYGQHQASDDNVLLDVERRKVDYERAYVGES